MASAIGGGPTSAPEPTGRRYWWIVGLGCAGVVSLLLLFSVPEIQAVVGRTLELLTKGDLPALKAFLVSFGALTPLLAATLMVINAFVPVFPSLLLTVLNGMLFGPIWGTTLSWGSSMLGAAGGFLLARHYGRPWVERWVGLERLCGVDRFFDAYGAHAVLVGRLIPVVSFKALNFGLGLTTIRFWPYWAMTGVGMVPATFVYSTVGDQIPGMALPWWLGAGGLLLFAAALWYGVKVVEKRATTI